MSVWLEDVRAHKKDDDLSRPLLVIARHSVDCRFIFYIYLVSFCFENSLHFFFLLELLKWYPTVESLYSRLIRDTHFWILFVWAFYFTHFYDRIGAEQEILISFFADAVSWRQWPEWRSSVAALTSEFYYLSNFQTRVLPISRRWLTFSADSIWRCQCLCDDAEYAQHDAATPCKLRKVRDAVEPSESDTRR